MGWEYRMYFAVYIVYLFYGLYNIFSVRKKILEIARVRFSDGWFGVDSFRDDSNDELENFNSYISKWWFWYIVHTVSSILFCRLWPQRRSLGYAVTCILTLFCTVKLLFLAILVCQLITYYCISLRPSKSKTWALSALWMVVINMIKNSEMWYKTLGYTEYFTLILTLSWSVLRCCSFVLNKSTEISCSHRTLEEKYSMEDFFGYTLYFPCMVHGPFLSYRRYYSSFSDKKRNYTFKFQCLFFELIDVAFWWLMLRIALHFLYIHYMARDIEAVKLITPTFGQHAVGYFMGQFFFVYYVVTYGLAIAFANFDDRNPPNPPRCIGCIHSYADMWKYFDEGLYEFLFRHIYAEICRKDSGLLLKLLATAATFTFVFIWHGCYNYVLIWSILNFSCLVAEKCFKALVTSKIYQNWTLTHLGPKNAQRLYAFLGTQLFIPSAFSNVYFISGMEVGNYLMYGAYRKGTWNFLALTFCSYCFFQCAEIISKRRKPEHKCKRRFY